VVIEVTLRFVEGHMTFNFLIGFKLNLTFSFFFFSQQRCFE